MAHPSRVEIDLGALAANVGWIKSKVGPAVQIMAVVKANAYGHGAPAVAHTALRSGAELLAVANLAEGFELREAGIDAPILVLSYVPPNAIGEAIASDLSLSVFDEAFAAACLSTVRRARARLKVHVKVDTGMGRLGLSPAVAPERCRQLSDAPGISLEGVYTHFATADDDQSYMRQQLSEFKDLLARMRRLGIQARHIHAANSAAILNDCKARFNLVRPGVMLYGLEPMPNSGAAAHLQPVMSWKTQVAQVRTLPPDSPVGYGNAYRTSGEEIIAVAPVGYADGLRRTPYTWREVLIRGQRAPLAGRVSMEKITIDVSRIPGVRAGDEVVLLGRQGVDRISAAEIAGWIGSNNYEVVTTIAPRVPRVYLAG